MRTEDFHDAQIASLKNRYIAGSMSIEEFEHKVADELAFYDRGGYENDLEFSPDGMFVRMA